jgi:cytochrome P450
VATVEEAARWSSPIQLTARVARTDVVFRDVAIQAGEQVWAILASANRDGEFFDDPDAFEIDRHSPPHLAFGFGDHLALGTHLARMEAQIGLRLLVRRFPRLRLACESVEPGGSWQVRRPALLPATVGD